MWKMDLMEALEKFWELVNPYTTSIKEIAPAVDGIVIRTAEKGAWKFWYESRLITKLEPWRKTRSDNV
jgi:hypothetical protein